MGDGNEMQLESLTISDAKAEHSSNFSGSQRTCGKNRGQKGYKPSEDGQRILDLAWEYVQSVPYKVSARWLFYRLIQDGTYADKAAYKTQFLPLLSRARKAFYGPWRPDTLADGTRTPIWRGHGHSSAEDWLVNVAYSLGCTLDKWRDQPNCAVILFEAEAMSAQFEHYTENISLFPFRGDASVSFKWQIVQHIGWCAKTYGKPIVLLYFGDLDPKGLKIPEAAMKDIRAWTKAEFKFIRCGLNPGDEERFGLPENPEKPGTYQWEALSDEQAKALITEWVNRYVKREAFKRTEAKERAVTQWFREKMCDLVLAYRTKG